MFLRAKEKEKESEKEKKRERKRKSFETYSRIHHSPFGFVLPSSFNLGVVGWQRCNNIGFFQ